MFHYICELLLTITSHDQLIMLHIGLPPFAALRAQIGFSGPIYMDFYPTTTAWGPYFIQLTTPTIIATECLPIKEYTY